MMHAVSVSSNSRRNQPSYLSTHSLISFNSISGVSKVDANIEEKTVIVTAEGVTAEEMVEKLSKWSAASGKYVRIP